jgi:hypothetical protein
MDFVERNIYDASIFDKDLNLSNKFRVDFTIFLNESSFAFTQNCVKILSDQSIILLIRTVKQNARYLAVAYVENGQVADLTQSSEAIEDGYNAIDAVIDESDNVIMLLSDRKDPTTIANYKLVVYEKATGTFTEAYSYQNTAKIYKLALDQSREKVHIINAFSPEVNSGIIRLLSYSLKTKEASLSGFMVKSTVPAAKVGIETVHEHNETLLRITGSIST